MIKDRVIIRTKNPDPENPDGKEVVFKINPSGLSVTQSDLSTLKKTRGGFVKVYMGDGSFNLSFSGVVPLLPDIAHSIDVNTVNLKDCPMWKWFENFSQFVRKNKAYLFELHYFGTPVMLSKSNPVFIGDCSPVSFNLSSEAHLVINYSFTFTGILSEDTFDLDLYPIAEKATKVNI